MEVFVKLLSGKNVALKAEPEETVERLKARIFDVEGVTIDLQRLTFAGKWKIFDELYINSAAA